MWARINTGPSESGGTVFPCDVTFWQVYLCWRLPGCRLVSENGLALPTRLRSSVLRIVTFCPFLCFYSFAADFQSYSLSNRGGGTLVCWASAAFRGHPHSSWSWSSAFREMNSQFTINFVLTFSAGEKHLRNQCEGCKRRYNCKSSLSPIAFLLQLLAQIQTHLQMMLRFLYNLNRKSHQGHTLNSQHMNWCRLSTFRHGFSSLLSFISTLSKLL